MKKKSNKESKQLTGKYIIDFDYDGSVVLVPLDEVDRWEKWLKKANVFPAPALPDYVSVIKRGLSSVVIHDPIFLDKQLVNV